MQTSQWYDLKSTSCVILFSVVHYAFSVLHAEALFAGHHPDNHASCRILEKLDFKYIGTNYYPPTGLYHPSYELRRP
jgi:RimJ/RimL family protein N-acetyltransferase